MSDFFEFYGSRDLSVRTHLTGVLIFLTAVLAVAFLARHVAGHGRACAGACRSGRSTQQAAS